MNKNENILSFEDFINEGVAAATAGSSFGMGNVSAPTVSAIPGDVAGSKAGSGDVVAHAVGTATKQSAKPIKKVKKRKFQLEPKNVRMSGTNTPKESMYVTKWSDWSNAK